MHIVDYVPSASVTWYVSSATAGVSPLLPTPAHESAVPTKLRECLLAGLPLIAETGGPTMLARISVMRALNRHAAIVYNPDLKVPHWGKRKLKRDKLA